MKNSISLYKIVYPASTSEAGITAAKELQNYIKLISGAELEIKTDEAEQSQFEICVGFTNRSENSAELQKKLGDEGFVIETKNEKLFILGSKVRGALYGVYTLLEKYFGCGFYTSEYTKIPTNPNLEITDILRDEQIPVFEYRDIDFVTTRKNDFQYKLKANGRYCARNDSFGGNVSYAVGFVHTLPELIPVGEYFDKHPEYFALNLDGTRQSGWEVQHCLSNPEVYKIVKEKVRTFLKNDPSARIASISQGDCSVGTLPCMCEKCQKVYEEEGSYAGTIIRFVNSIAKELKDEFPLVKFDTLAYKYSRPVPKTAPEDNVIIRLCSIECCFSHPLEGRCKEIYAVTGGKQSFVEDLVDWGKKCDNIYIWDYATNYTESMTFFPNLKVLLHNARFFADNNVKGLYEEGNYFSETADFPELRSYLMAKILWNPYMSEEEYEGYIDQFLKDVYGNGWKYIREYIDMAQDMVKDIHFGIYEPFCKTHFAPEILDKKNEKLVSTLTLDKIKNYQTTNWDEYLDYTEQIIENPLTQKGEKLFRSALELATEEEASRINKIMLQIDIVRSHYLHKKYGKQRVENCIKALLSDFFATADANISEEEKEKLTTAVSEFVAKKCEEEYITFNKSIFDRAMKYGMYKFAEPAHVKYINASEVCLSNTPYEW